MTNILNELSVDTIEGIGDVYAEKLKKRGINTLDELLLSHPVEIEQILERPSKETIQKWRSMALFLSMKGMNENIAEAFADNGRETFSDIAEVQLRTLENYLKNALDNNKLNSLPNLYELSEIQREAYERKERGIIIGKIVHPKTSSPLKGVEVVIDRNRTFTTKNGVFFHSSVRQGVFKIYFSLNNKTTVSSITITKDQLNHSGCWEIDFDEINYSELSEDKGDILNIHGSSRVRFVELEASSIKDNSYWIVRKPLKNGNVSLLNLNRIQKGPDLFVERYRTTLDSLPNGSLLDTILSFQQGEFTLSDLTIREFHWKKIAPLLGERSAVLHRKFKPVFEKTNQELTKTSES